MQQLKKGTSNVSACLLLEKLFAANDSTNATNAVRINQEPFHLSMESSSAPWDPANCSQLLNVLTNDQMSDSPLEFPRYLSTTATIVCSIILILGTTGNILVPIVVIKTKELRNSTNIFLINLSIADLLVLIVCMPTVLIELQTKPEIWHLGKGMCKAVPFLEMVVAHGSILTILAISFERYYAICKPLKACYKCTMRRALMIIVFVWTVAVVATIPVLFGTELSQAHSLDGSLVPVCLTQASTTWQKIYYLTSMTAFFWAPLCVLLVVYSVITKRLVLDDRLRCNSDGGLTCNSEHSQMRARRQVVFMLAAVVICFFICLLPFRLLTLWLIIASEDQIKELSMEAFYNLLYFCRIMLYVNSMLNPCLYAVVSSKFRDAFVVVLCCRRRNRPLVRQGTFNTTSSSVVMSSLKNSLHRAVQTNSPSLNSPQGITNVTIHNLESPVMSLKNPLFEAKFCDKSKHHLENISSGKSLNDSASCANIEDDRITATTTIEPHESIL